MPAGSTGMCVSPTYTMLRDSTLSCFLELTRTGNVLRTFNKSDMTATLINGTTVLFRSSDEPDRLRGVNLSWFHLDEGGLCSEDTWKILIARLRLSPGRAWVTSTPRGFQNWLYEVFVKHATPDYEVIHSRTHDNVFLPENFIERLESNYTSGWRDQELEGLFCELEGALFQRSWFKTVNHAPDALQWFRFWDLAASQKTTADFTSSACVALSKDSGDVYIRDVIKLKQEWPTIRKLIISTAENEPGVAVGIESALHGLVAVQELRREPAMVNTELRSISVHKDKVSRALPLAARAEDGKVKLVDGPWIRDFLDELSSFPNGNHDDQVDSASGALAMITRRRILYA